MFNSCSTFFLSHVWVAKGELLSKLISFIRFVSLLLYWIILLNCEYVPAIVFLTNQRIWIVLARCIGDVFLINFIGVNLTPEEQSVNYYAKWEVEVRSRLREQLYEQNSICYIYYFFASCALSCEFCRAVVKINRITIGLVLDWFNALTYLFIFSAFQEQYIYESHLFSHLFIISQLPLGYILIIS